MKNITNDGDKQRQTKQEKEKTKKKQKKNFLYSSIKLGYIKIIWNSAGYSLQ